MNRRIIILGLGILLCMASVVSCQKEQNNITNRSVVSTPKASLMSSTITNMTAGQIHNYYLSRYFALYKDQPINSPMTYNDDYLLTKRFNQMMLEDGLLPPDINIDSITTMELNLSKEWGFYNADGTLKSSNETTQLNIDNISNPEIKNALQLVKDYTGESKDFLTFGKDKFNSITTRNTEILPGIKSIFESSYNFWNQYQGNNPSMAMGWFEHMVDADIAGYERGTLVCHLAGIWDPAVVGAVAAANAAKVSAKAIF